MKRIILYYPTINITNSNWIKQAILYWDAIGSIIPEELEESREVNEDIRILQSHDAFVPFRPENYITGNEELMEEFLAIYHSEDYDKVSRIGVQSHSTFQIFSGKMSPALIERMIQERIASRKGYWLTFHSRTAMLYMSLLAKYLANNANDNVVIPGTDWQGYQQIAFSIQTTYLKPALCLKLYQALPVPSEDVSLEKILEFKRKRQDELLAFRLMLLDYQDKAKAASTYAELTDVVLRFSETMERKISILNRLGKDEKVPLGFGTVDIILSISPPGLLSILSPDISSILATAAMGVSGAIKLAKLTVDERNRQRRILEDNEFAYLYYAREAAIID